MGLRNRGELCPGCAERAEDQKIRGFGGGSNLLANNLDWWSEMGRRLFEKEREEVVRGIEGVPHV